MSATVMVLHAAPSKVVVRHYEVLVIGFALSCCLSDTAADHQFQMPVITPKQWVGTHPQDEIGFPFLHLLGTLQNSFVVGCFGFYKKSNPDKECPCANGLFV